MTAKALPDEFHFSAAHSRRLMRCERLVAACSIGTKARSDIQSGNEVGIRPLVKQTFEVGKQAIANDLVPMLEPEIDIQFSRKACYDILLESAPT